MKKIKLSVLFGGTSNEHEVSVNSAQQIMCYLNPEKYTIRPVFISKKGEWYISRKPVSVQKGFSIKKWIRSISPATCSTEMAAVAKNCDIVFIGLHGTGGEDGTIQGFLKTLGVPYTGTKVVGSAVAFNKIHTKEIYKQNKLPTPNSLSVSKNEWKRNSRQTMKKIRKRVGIPCVIKVPESGSSRQMGIACTAAECSAQINSLMRHASPLLIEEYIKGEEFSCGVLEYNGMPMALPATQIVPRASSFFDYKAKYNANGSEEITPAPVSKKQMEAFQRYALAAHRLLNCRVYSRTDIMVRQGKLYILETNTLPGMTVTSLLPQQALAAGIGYPQLLDIIITESLKG